MLYVQTYKNGYLVLLTFNVIVKQKYKIQNEYMVKVMYPSQFSKWIFYLYKRCNGFESIVDKVIIHFD